MPNSLIDWTTEDLDDKGNYPDGKPPTASDNFWALHEPPYFQKVDFNTLLRYAYSPGTTKVMSCSNGIMFALYVFGPGGSGVEFEKNIIHLSYEEKVELIKLVREVPKFIADKHRIAVSKALYFLLKADLDEKEARRKGQKVSVAIAGTKESAPAAKV